MIDSALRLLRGRDMDRPHLQDATVSNTFLLKLGALLVTLALAMAGGLYLSGVLVPLLLKVQATTPWYATWWSYFQVLDLPQVKPHAAKIKFATVIGFGLPLLAWLPLSVLIFKPRHKALHGDARFATPGDLARKDMFKPSADGVVVATAGAHGAAA